MAKLTAKQEAFCREYLKDLNATQAAVRAGYSEKTAQEQSSRLLSNVMVSDFVSKLKAERNERTETDYDWVLVEAKKSYQINATVTYDDDGTPKMVNPTAAAKFLELAGKHTKVKAFVEDKTEDLNEQSITINFVPAKKPDAD